MSNSKKNASLTLNEDELLAVAVQKCPYLYDCTVAICNKRRIL